MGTSAPDIQAVVDEARKTAEAASHLANGEYPEDADHVRVLAGIIQQLAEQVERLAREDPSPPSGFRRRS